MNVDGSMTRPVTELRSGDGQIPSNPAGRRCEHPECDTRLSRYNPDGLCNAHGGWSDSTVKRPGRQPLRRQPEPEDELLHGRVKPAALQLLRGERRPEPNSGDPSASLAMPLSPAGSPEGVRAEIDLEPLAQSVEDVVDMQPLLAEVGKVLADSDLAVQTRPRGAIVLGALADVMDCVEAIHRLAAGHVDEVATNVRVVGSPGHPGGPPQVGADLVVTPTSHRTD